MLSEAKERGSVVCSPALGSHMHLAQHTGETRIVMHLNGDRMCWIKSLRVVHVASFTKLSGLVKEKISLF